MRDLLFMGFNQDASCVSIGTRQGYRIFNCQPFGRNIFSSEKGGIGIVEMLFCTSLVALVGAPGGEDGVEGFSPCHLKLWNTKTAQVICELDFETEIQAVKMNRKRLIVVLETKLHVYDLDAMVNLQTLEISTFVRQLSNDESSFSLSCPLCELSPSDSNSFLALPANSISGDVFLYDALNLVEFKWINAHKAPLAALKFSLDGTILATASETGTVIRVFKVPSGEKLYSFRRGTYSATIYSLAFDAKNTMLAASTSNGSVHVFALKEGSKLETKYNNSDHEHDHVSSSNNHTHIENNNVATSEENGNHHRQQQQQQLDGTMEGNSLNYSEQSSATSPSASGGVNPHSSTNFFGMAASNAYALFERRKDLAGKFLPNALNDIVEPSRCFAIAHLKKPRVVSACAVAKGLLCVVTSDGHFCQYSMAEKGECQLVFEISLLMSDGSGKNDDDSSSNSSSNAALRFFK